MEPLTNDTGATSQVKASTQGAQSPALAAQRDIHYIERQEVFTEPDFAAVNTEDFLPPKFPLAGTVQELLGDLDRHSFVLLGRVESDDLQDKRTFAVHVGACLGRALEMPVMEWVSDSAPGAPRLDHRVCHEAQPTIFLLNDLRPTDVDYDVSRLITSAENGSHCVIATTQSTQQAWTNMDPKRYWRGIPHGRAYPPDYLEDLLRSELEVYHQHWPPCLEQCLASDQLIPGTSVREAASRIRHPLRIINFVRDLHQDPLPRDAADIAERLDALDGSRNAVRKWFLRLTHKDQILALGLCLFHGLIDDQMFAALEELIETAWRQRDPQQETYDYDDLLRVGAYFRAEQARHGQPIRIEATSEHLDILFDLSWEFHRRRLLSSLPVMANLASRAVKDRPWLSHSEDRSREDETAQDQTTDTEPALEEAARHTRWYRTHNEAELFGSPFRNRQLRSGLVETLGRISRLSLEGTHAVLRELATEKSAGCREIVAHALIFHCQMGTAEAQSRLVALLEEWERARVRRALRFHSSAQERLGATVALTLGGAARLRLPEHLQTKLTKLLHRLVERSKQETEVRRALQDPVLPRLLAWRPEQMAPMVETLISLDPNLRLAAAQGLAEAYEDNPQFIATILETWRRTLWTGKWSRARHEGMAVIVAQTYGLVRSSDSGSLTPESILRKLGEMLGKEDTRKVREACLDAALFQCRSQFAAGDTPLQNLIHDTVRLSDRRYLMKLLTHRYLAQRRELGPGDGSIAIGECRYEIWFERSDRPLTDVETGLYYWLLNSSKPVTQQIAVEAFGHFSRTELDRREATMVRPDSQAPHAIRRSPITQGETTIRREHPLPTLAYLALWFVTRDQTRFLERLYAPLAQWLYLERFPGLQPRGILDRWRSTSIADLPRFQRILEKALNLYGLRQVILLVVFLLISTLFLSLLN